MKIGISIACTCSFRTALQLYKLGREMEAAIRPLNKPVSRVILDLDGTLLKTDGIVGNVLRACLVDYGRQWDARNAHRIAGKTPLEAAAAVVEDYELPCTPHDLMAKASPMFLKSQHSAKALPGAYRLINHLRVCGVPIALASNSHRSSIERKISPHHGWKEAFSVIISSEDVKKGKPSPDIFLEAAKRMNAEPSDCLVIQDSQPGVQAGKAAGMEVVAIPSLPEQSGLCRGADKVITSLFDLNPSKWGLPPFTDLIDNTLPIQSWFLHGPVVRDHGHGSKILGVPTELASGIYFRWAHLPNRTVYKMVMNVGWKASPLDVERMIGDCSSLSRLARKIHENGKIEEKVLDLPPYVHYRDCPYLRSS